MRSHIHSLRARLILIVLVAVVPSLGGAFASALDDRNTAVLRAESDVLRIANLISSQFDRVVESTHATLVGFAAVPAVRYHVVAECSSFARTLREISPVFANIGATDATGDVFCSGYPLSEPLSTADRAYFRESLRSRSLIGSSYQISRSTGKPTVSYALPVTTDQGEVLAVVLASLDLDYLSAQVADFGVPPGYSLMIVENSGRILIRYPDPDFRLMDSIPRDTIESITGSRGEGVATTTLLDGREQIVGFRRLSGLSSDSPVYVLVGVSSDAVRNESYVRLIGTLTGIGLSALFALAFALVGGQSIVVQPIQSLLGSLARLKAGDYSVRAEVATNTAEIQGLGAAFDEVAAALESREAAISETTTALREREEQYRLVFEGAADGIVLSDAESGRILDANGVSLWLYGYSREELLRMYDYQLSAEPEKTIQSRRADVRRVPLRYHRRKDGSVFAIEVAASVIRVGGRLVRLSSVRDITAKLESERALRESETRHRLLFSQMISGFALAEVVCDATGEPVDLRFLEINAALERQTGLDRNVAIGRTVLEVEPQIENRWIKRLGSVALNGDSISFTDQLSVIGKEFEVYAYSPQPGQVAATLQDVTERRNAERELEQRTRDLQTLHEIAGVLVSEQDLSRAIGEILGLAREAVDADLCLLYATPETAAELNRPADEQSAHHRSSEVGPRLLLIATASRNTDVPPVSHADSPAWIEVPVQGREGNLGVVRAGRSELFGDHERRFLLAVGHHLGLAIENNHLAADATQVEVLRQMDRLRSEFIANMSHELRTPLGLIVFLTSTLRSEGARLSEQVRADLIASIEEEAGRLSRLVENLVDISKLQSGRLSLQRQWLDLREPISGTVRDLSPRLADYRVDLDLPTEPIRASVDRVRFEQVLRNLLMNAMQYSDPGTKITVSARDLAGLPCVTVRDQGIGISPGDTQRIFERFYRADSEHGRRVSGVGLGLAICRSIVRAHGGDIRVESNPGEGSSFFFTLPTPAAESPAELEAARSASSPTKASQQTPNEPSGGA